MQSDQQMQPFWPRQNTDSDPFCATNNNWLATQMDNSNATMHEWDLYHWLQDLTDLKDAFGSEIPSFPKASQRLDSTSQTGTLTE